MTQFLITNWQYKLLSVLIAGGMWLIVRDERVQEQIEVKVEVEAPTNLVVASEPPSTLRVEVSGTRPALDRLRRTGNRPTFRTRPRVTEPGRIEVRVLPEDIRLPTGVRPIQVSPPRFEVLFEREVSQRVAVQARLLGEPAEGFVVGRPLVEPGRVRVVGAASLLRGLETVYTEPISIEGLRETFGGPFEVHLPYPQLQLESPNTRVTVTVPIVPDPALLNDSVPGLDLPQESPIETEHPL